MFADPGVTFWLSLILRMMIIAAVVVAASVLVERSNPFVGALVASLPIAAIAAYIILALERDATFVALTTIGSITGLTINAPFGLIYAILARRQSLAVSLGGAFAFWLLCAIAIRSVDWTILSACLFAAVVFPSSIVLSFHYAGGTKIPARAIARRSDIAWRAVTVAVFVGAITLIGQSVGPFVAGLFAVFPAVMASFVIIMHSRIGGPATAAIIAQLQVSAFGLSLGFLPIFFGAEVLGVWPALALGFTSAMIWKSVLLTIQHRVLRTRHS